MLYTPLEAALGERRELAELAPPLGGAQGLGTGVGGGVGARAGSGIGSDGVGASAAVAGFGGVEAGGRTLGGEGRRGGVALEPGFHAAHA